MYAGIGRQVCTLYRWAGREVGKNKGEGGLMLQWRVSPSV